MPALWITWKIVLTPRKSHGWIGLQVFGSTGRPRGGSGLRTRTAYSGRRRQYLAAQPRADHHARPMRLRAGYSGRVPDAGRARRLKAPLAAGRLNYVSPRLSGSLFR